jgi:hypothetical protein
MTDYHRIVDDIRSFLHSSDQTYSDTLKGLAAEYAGACKEVNQRLRRCEEYLQKGLRSEAIHFAQGEPVLLDAVAALDFPERAEWEEVALTYGLPPPPKLRLETAEALNKAYSEEQPVEQFLRQHRRLALKRAPLVQRLAVMHQLADADPTNPIWTEDLPVFEQARFKQISRDLQAALSTNDLDAIFGLWEEIQGGRWFVQPPADLVNAFTTELPRRRHVRARQTCERVARELKAAYSVRNEAGARKLQHEWLQLLQQLELGPADPLWEQAGPALRWLADKDRQVSQDQAYGSAVADFERAFYRGASVQELEQEYYKLRKFQRGVPQELEQRYRERVSEVRTAAQRRERLLLAAAFAFGTLLLVGLILFLALRG